jgi:hypothetical protein
LLPARQYLDILKSAALITLATSDGYRVVAILGGVGLALVIALAVVAAIPWPVNWVLAATMRIWKFRKGLAYLLVIRAKAGTYPTLGTGLRRYEKPE